MADRNLRARIRRWFSRRSETTTPASLSPEGQRVQRELVADVVDTPSDHLSQTDAAIPLTATGELAVPEAFDKPAKSAAKKRDPGEKPKPRKRATRAKAKPAPDPEAPTGA